MQGELEMGEKNEMKNRDNPQEGVKDGPAVCPKGGTVGGKKRGGKKPRDVTDSLDNVTPASKKKKSTRRNGKGVGERNDRS